MRFIQLSSFIQTQDVPMVATDSILFFMLKNCNLLTNQIFESPDSMSGILPSGLGQDYHQTDFLYDSDI